MRLNEIFEATANPADIKTVADTLDKFVYQPEEKLKKRQPVLDVEIPTSDMNHFVQRFNQRSDKAKFTLKDIFNLLARAKADPSMGYASELDALSRENNPHDDIVIQGDDKLTIPVLVKSNPKCAKQTDGNPVCPTANGKLEPKNIVIPKTVYRKGIDD